MIIRGKVPVQKVKGQNHKDYRTKNLYICLIHLLSCLWDVGESILYIFLRKIEVGDKMHRI